MNITLHSIASQSVSLFKEKIIPVLTTQRERIAAVVAVALGCLALCLMYRCFKTNFSASTITTWNFRKDSTDEEPQELPEGYEWVSDGIFLKENPSQAIIISVAKAAAIVPGENNTLLIGDLAINATYFEQMQAIVQAVANDREKVRAIFSALFTMSSKDPSFNVGEKVQWVANLLSGDQLRNVLALANDRHGEESDFYQREIIEISDIIKIDNYLDVRYRSIFPKKFIAECKKLVQYRDYASSQFNEQQRKLQAKMARQA